MCANDVCATVCVRECVLSTWEAPRMLTVANSSLKVVSEPRSALV